MWMLLAQDLQKFSQSSNSWLKENIKNLFKLQAGWDPEHTKAIWQHQAATLFRSTGSDSRTWETPYICAIQKPGAETGVVLQWIPWQRLTYGKLKCPWFMGTTLRVSWHQIARTFDGVLFWLGLAAIMGCQQVLVTFVTLFCQGLDLLPMRPVSPPFFFW